MKDHPIPQDVTGYRFHIVGNMTLKQFLEVAGGVVAAVIIYKTGLPAIIKWPFIVLFAGVGAGMAFLPIAERPLDHWIITYFSVLFKPTKFYWRKVPKVPDLFSYKQNTDKIDNTTQYDVGPLKKRRVSEYVASITENDQDEYENIQKIYNVLSFFQQPGTTPVPAPVTETSVTPLPQTSTEVTEQSVPTPTPQIKTVQNRVVGSKPTGSSVQIASTKALSFQKNQDDRRDSSTPNPSDLGIVFDSQQDLLNPQTTSVADKIISTPQALSMPVPEVGEGVFNTSLPFPQTPTKINTLVGMVLNQRNEMIPGAIIEIRNQSGQVERAVKSNALGQFFITTPLKTGEYVVYVEADDYTFEPFGFTINNSILSPLEIRAQN